MERVTFISAGAGSGKTYSLTKQIVEFIKSGTCTADEIILTTFTRAAASELREKVRTALYKEGLYDAAVQIDNAAIGTIHSIAYQLVARYWYLLGISADVRMIADDDQSFYVTQSLAGLPGEADLHLFSQMVPALNITHRIDSKTLPNPDFWKGDMESIIDKIENFCIDAAGIEKSKKVSLQTLAEVLNTGTAEVNLEEVRKNAHRVQQASYRLKRGNPGNKQKQIQDLIRTFENNLRKTDALTLNVSAYIALVKGIADIKTKEYTTLCPDEFEFFASLPDKILADPRTYALAGSYIGTIFRLALKWQEEYKQFKDERRLLDFNDVQRYFARLLDRPEVVDEIRSRYKVALVDEFQDCSPQQVRFFSRLSELMQRSVWVGDLKQAIYNFRGTDTELVKEIIDCAGRKENGNELLPLKHCWRSNETIVNLANSVFTVAFQNTLDENLVRLDMPPADAEGYRKPEEHELCHWHFNVDKADDRFDAMAMQIKRLRDEKNLDYKDMAILCRINPNAASYAKALRRAGIPYRMAAEANGGEDNPIFDFLTALVSVAAHGDNSFSQALVAYYIEQGCTAAKILSDRLRSLDSGDGGRWLTEAELLQRVAKLSTVIGNQSVASAVETLTVELNAIDLIRRIDPTADAYDYCQILIAAARNYEDQCANLGLGCSLPGFVDFVRQRKLGQSGDENGVTVLTYHKSKGLEWRCVILTSLHEEQIVMSKVFSGVQVLRGKGEATVMLFPTAIFDICTSKVKTRIAAHENYRHLELAASEESKRLMYVGMTRPREMLITTSAQSSRSSYDTKWLRHITGTDMGVAECQADYLTWFGNQFRNLRIDYDAALAENVEAAYPPTFKVLRIPAEDRSYKLRDILPSRVDPSERLEGVEAAGSFSTRLTAHAGNDAVLGNCLHHLLCIYRDTAEFADTAASVAAEYGVTLDSREFIASAHALYDWLERTYGAPLAVEREVPFRFQTEEGQIVSGEIDMIYRTAGGDVLVDYKSYPGAVGNLTDPASLFYAGKYSGQIALYEEAMRRAGRKVCDRLICYFSLGAVIRLIFK